jgi:hypothetical protein
VDRNVHNIQGVLMAINPPLTYGRDVRCIADCDDMMSEAVGLDVIVQDAIHRITCDSVLGPGGDGWGKDCRTLIGLTRQELAGQQPIYAEVLERDERINSAEVTLRSVTRNGLADVEIEAVCQTELGPFALIKSVSELTAADIEGQA